jgi:hypothetical protein
LSFIRGRPLICENEIIKGSDRRRKKKRLEEKVNEKFRYFFSLFHGRKMKFHHANDVEVKREQEVFYWIIMRPSFIDEL